ncbi:M48 family metallopeptidase [Thermosipho sp. 1244]|uniref:M48 family metallopeptidase n=1 Tax=Thermosipho sp. 1244 TaxID=1755816 RepID=UPI001BDE0606|nr:M48 family metallopeptidase [Thermosipho sp. 1244]MBT1247126.1 peptidase [Thermosipho sp. 1244]
MKFILLVVILQVLWEIILEFSNVLYSKKHTDIPDVLKDRISHEHIRQSLSYLSDKAKVKIVSAVVNLFVLLIFILYGFPYLEKLVSSVSNFLILQGLLFFGIYWLITLIVGIPINFYLNFVVEKKYRFNTMTYRTFFGDVLKNALVTVILFVPLISLIVYVISVDNNWWWKVSLIFVVFQSFVLFLYPLVIIPLFNKLTPLEDKELKDKIRKLSTKIKDVYVMDASKRTKKQNAFLTGIGKSKRLVLFDTILEYPKEEILAIVAHELGHYEKRHIPKLLVISSVFYTFIFYITNVVYTYVLNYVDKPYTAFIYAFIFVSHLMFFVMPFINKIQRKFEFEADEYSVEKLKTSKYLTSALKRLMKENLINLNPLPLYKVWYYNHPSVEERIKYCTKIYL